MADETVPCPGCAAPMGLDQEVCEACRRPRDELEIQRGRDLIAERAEKRRRLPITIAYRALAVAALVLAFHFRGLFFAQVAELRDEVNRGMKDIENPPEPPATTSAKPTPRAVVIALLGGPPPSPPDSPAPASPPALHASTPVHPAVPPPAQARIAVIPKEPRDAPSSGSRCLYGVVYDLKTLRPVPQAIVSISQEASAIFQTRTDGDGHYQVDFYPDPSLFITVTAAGYREGQIEDPESSYIQQSLKERASSSSRKLRPPTSIPCRSAFATATFISRTIWSSCRRRHPRRNKSPARRPACASRSDLLT
jgi:hypothetical protein